MPYRVDVPEGSEPLEYFMYHVGTRQLVEGRQRLYATIFDAPETSLTPREREGPRILMAKRVNCPTCISVRLWRDMPGYSDEEIPEVFYENAINANAHWEGFSVRESLLVEFADRFENDVDNINADDDFWARIYANFTEAEVGDALIMLSTWMGAGRVVKVLGAVSVCRMPDTEQLTKLLTCSNASTKTPSPDLVAAE